MSDSPSGYGQMRPTDTSSEYSVLRFLIRQQLALVRTAVPVKVMAVTTDDQVGPVGFVDILPLVNLLDGQGNATQHITVYHLPYTRLQGGKNAIIIDPVVNDIGWAICADRDISSVKANKAQANPGSGRRFDLADAIYVGGILNAAPTQWLRFVNEGGLELIDQYANKFQMTSAGIKLTDTNGNVIEMKSDGIHINGVLFDRSQNISNVHNETGNGEVTFNGHTLTAHHHGGVTTGSGNTAGPTG